MSKLIVATGGTRGIGRAILDRFASERFDIVTCSRTLKDLEKIRDAFTTRGVQAHVFCADLSSRSGADAFASFVLGLKRPVDVLVNNAGHFIPGSVIDEPDGALEEMINSHVYSSYYLTRALVKEMRTRRSGHIFNMCSIASIAAYPNGGSYTIAKFAQLGFSKVLREELKTSGVRVTAVLPGATRTASWDGTELPDDRFIKPEDVAEAVFSAWTLSDRSVVEELLIRPQQGDI